MPDVKRKAFHGGVVGSSGTGKTQYGVQFWTQSRHDRILIFDHQGEYESRLGKLCVTTEDINEVVALAEQYRIIAYDPVEQFPGELETALAVWCDLVWRMARLMHEQKNIETLVVIDELQKIVDKFQTPVEVKTLVQTGRKFGLDTWFTSQQPNELPNEVRNQWTEVTCFRLTDQTPLDFVSRWFNQEQVEEISRLADGNYFWKNLVTSEIRRDTLQFAKSV